MVVVKNKSKDKIMKKLGLTALLAGAAFFAVLGTTSLSAAEKCGAGKCGTDKKVEKCGAGKCGTDKKAPKAAMKCGAGKCGTDTKAVETPKAAMKCANGKCGAGKCGAK